MPQFVHLHNHTEFSLLDGAAKIDKLLDKAVECGMCAAGISDHGNLYGVPKFALEARKRGLKPIIGSEFYLGQDHLKRSGSPDSRELYHQILFAKNDQGYRNLIKLSSISFVDGFYYKPRIDRGLLERYHEGLIASTCCLASEINQLILKKKTTEAEDLFRWYLDLFGADYYVEIHRHGLAEQDHCNLVLLDWAKRYGVKIIATNDVHYVNEADSEAHDLLLALQTSADYADPKRFRFLGDTGQLNKNFFFKSPDEMEALFADIPHALENTLEIVDKCSFELNLSGNMMLPTFRVPEGQTDMNSYLAELTWAGARAKYSEISQDLSERITHELNIIKQMEYEGYFLIVQEFTNEARKRGVMVGPGRGSAAGSVVAYCIGIIDIDPIAYNLIFERFLNPERISPPDIDIDFDDSGREAVINFVVEKYGRESVSQIVTYGTMGAKTAIRDVGRVMGIPLAEVNRIAKYVPERPGMTFEKALQHEDNADGYMQLQEAFASPDANLRKMMEYARTLEGTARHTGIHAAGIVIAPGLTSDYVPVSVGKEKAVVIQYDGPSAELAGLLKMDFLGLKTLSILKTAVNLVEANHGIRIDIDRIDLSDALTYALYQAGETVATFQFESEGMRKYLRQLKPTCIEDLIAMNALYRPGPMDNIPEFIERKNGKKAIEYPHPLLEPILRNTYGIMVYQEQIMEAARVMAGYSLGGADLLRRAMGKKKKEVMAKEREKFVAGAVENQVEANTAGEVFDLMEKFASYGFNKSHSAAYSVLAFRTAYLKAHYPAEYMAAVLSHWLDNIDSITHFIEECRRMGVPVLPPSVNESLGLFSVDYPAGEAKNPREGVIRFGLRAIKGVGEGDASAIIAERQAGGPFLNIYDLTTRVPGKYLSKRVLESLAYAGAFDCFAGVERWQYFPALEAKNPMDELPILELALNYGTALQAERLSPQISLFGGEIGDSERQPEPPIPYKEPWPLIRKLNYERDVIGFYLSAHPLDRYRMELKRYASCTIAQLQDFKNRDKLKVGGIITQARERLSKAGTRYGTFQLEDFSGKTEFSLFKDDYAKWKGSLEIDNCVLVTGRYGPRFGQDEDNYELRVGEVQLLDGLLEQQTREITLALALATVEPGLIEKLETLFRENKGSCKVNFSIQESEETKPIVLHSRNYQVKPTPELLEELARLELPVTLR